jgi:hypothetical protein
MLALLTGARRGELCGLSWDDYDAESGTLAIRHSLSETLNGIALKETKTGCTRTLPLSQMANDALRSQKALQARERLARAVSTTIWTAPSSPMTWGTASRQVWQLLPSRASRVRRVSQRRGFTTCVIRRRRRCSLRASTFVPRRQCWGTHRRRSRFRPTRTLCQKHNARRSIASANASNVSRAAAFENARQPFGNRAQQIRAKSLAK